MKFKDAFEILRPINCLMGSLTVIIGILNTRTGIAAEVVLFNIIFGIITYFFLAGSGMIINDIYDIEIDKVNRPDRPIPSGRISLEQAKLLFIVTYGIGIVFAIINSILFNLGIINILIAAFFGFIGWIYAKWGKKSGFPGNIIVGISFSIGLIYGAVLNSSNIPNYIYFFFLTSFFLLMSREIVKGCEDIEGDRKEGVKTLAITIGLRRALFTSIICQTLAILFFILPILTPIINPLLFLIFMFFGLIIVGFALILSIRSKLHRDEFKEISQILKIGALVGLLTFLFASL